MIGGAKGIGIGIDFGIPNQYCRATSKPYIEKDVLDSLRVVASAYGKSNDDADRSIVKNLVDASNPFIISNAAFKLNSGFGEYKEDFTSWRIYPNIEVTDNVITTNGNFNSTWFIYKHSSESKINEMNIKVSGIPKGGKILYFYISDETANLPILYTIPKDGIYHLPESKINNNRASVGFTVGSSYDWNNIRIEQIPSFEGAFVTDGIDDLIKSTKSATKMLDGSNEVTVVSMIHQIKTNSDATRNNWFFTPVSYLENRVVENKTGKTGIYGYTSTNVTNAQISDITPILGDKNDYTLYSKIEDGDRDYFTVEGFQNQGIWYVSSIAWYWTIIANKVLTTDQINQVIAYFNLDRTLKPDILCDVKKQGITNENHAEFGDRLIDFSGNGRDIQLNNIAWKGDSGIGKYEVDFLDSSIWNSSNSTITSSKIDCKNAISHIMLLYYSVGSKEYPDIPSFKVIKTGADIDYSYIDETGSPKSVKIVDGVNILPASHNTLYSGSGRFCGFGNPGMGNSVTITQIPSHAGGLCLDGVNDFGKVTGMPVYKDYTFIIDYERISYASSEKWVAGVVSKSHVANQGAFILMTANTEVEPGKQAYSFGRVTPFNRDDFTRALLYQSKYKCGDVDLTVGEGVDSDTLWLGTFRDNDKRFFNGAIYSLMSFPYSMSEFLIERQLKKHKLGTLYPDMVEFRPVIKSNASYDNIVFYYKNEKVENGTYLTVGSSIDMHIRLSSNPVNEIKSITINGIPATFKFHDANNNTYQYDFNLTSKSPQKINITIDEYIRFEDIKQPYPVIFQVKDRHTSQIYNYGDKIKVGSSIQLSQGEKTNLLSGLYSIKSYEYEGKTYSYNQLTNLNIILTKQSISLSCNKTWLLDDNEPKCILSPRLLRIPNSSYKILGHIPDISGHGNHGKINNSAYAEGSGVNEDGSYQFDGVDDFVTIPTLSSGGKQMLMKVNWQSNTGDAILYDQRFNVYNYEFAIYNSNTDNYSENPHAYSSRNNGKTYIDGILNTYIKSAELQNVTHNIIATNELSSGSIPLSPIIGSNISHDSAFAQMSLYDFMLFDDISTDNKIKELNEYVGVEAKVELPPYYWDNYGKTNFDADRDTIQQRGIAVGDYDLTNTNFAYDKMSGFGGYEFAKFDNTLDWYNTEGNDSVEVVSRNGYSITLKRLTGLNFWYFQNSTVRGLISNDIPFKINSNKNITVVLDVHGLSISEGKDKSARVQELVLNPNEDNYTNLKALNEEELAQIDISTNSLYYLLWFDLSTLAVNEEVTIEMLPLYPNGLVYDGVDDYSENVNIPIVDDFTFLVKASLLKGFTGSGGLIARKGDVKHVTSGGYAFVYCLDSSSSEANRNSYYSFGKALNPSTGAIDPPLIGYMTKTSVNGVAMTFGTNPDIKGINFGDWNGGRMSMVVYKSMLYTKTIPLLQINFLKNLMEKDEIIDLTNPIFIQ
jgi:hypothetical protein